MGGTQSPSGLCALSPALKCKQKRSHTNQSSFCFEAGSYFVALTCLELIIQTRLALKSELLVIIRLSLLPKCWDYRWRLHQAFSLQLLDSFECSEIENMLPSQVHIASRQGEPLFSQIEYTGRRMCPLSACLNCEAIIIYLEAQWNKKKSVTFYIAYGNFWCEHLSLGIRAKDS